MKKLWLSIMILLLSANAFAVEKITDNKLKNDFAEIIRKNGYHCNSCKDVYFIGEDYRGFIYRIICSDNVLAFTLIVSTAGSFTVKPL